jgi:hypothetical protein
MFRINLIDITKSKRLKYYKLGSAASRILVLFSMYPYLSAYQIFNLLKMNEEKHGMAYKNVHTYVRQLHSLKLIDIVDKKLINTLDESIHHPIYYRLTTGGIFHLISKTNIFVFFSDSKKANTAIETLFQNYSDNIIFKTLLYPYFQKETLSKINNEEIIAEIINYLKKCCSLTEKITRLIKNIPYPFLLSPLFDWDNPEKYWISTMGQINDKFNLGFTKKPHVEKINGEEEIIKVTSDKKSVDIRLNDKKDAAILTTQDKKTYELPVTTFHGNYTVGIIFDSARKIDFDRLVHGINYNLLNLAVSMIMRITEKDFAGYTELSTDAYEILSQDAKLMSLLDKTKEVLEERYQTLVQLRKTN